MTLTCSAERLAVGEPLAGSAPYARLWVLLEQPGPWGRDALRESHLDAGVADRLAALVDGVPARVGLIRSVGAHADVTDGPRTLLVARTDPDASWFAARRIHDLEALPDALDVDALLSTQSAPATLPGEPLPTPSRAFLVCTNAKRDQCCAVLGRPLAAQLADRAAAASDGSVVWETSHTSGHRFAPTYLSLPDGYLFGGPDADSGSVEACRGRSSLRPAAQVAELAVLRHLGARMPRPLDVTDADAGRFLVRDGSRSFSVTVNEKEGTERPESCGKTPVSSPWMVASVQEVR
ncbi:MAG TPA: sucrase ferredoxin [Actinomycetes bacterium]|nr:sucrase ferredoxin [Actinomycetes bacterium]